MRNQLKDLTDSQRYTFTATFSGVGYKSYRDKYSPTLVLKDVKYDGHVITDHLWFNYTKGFGELGVLKAGDIIQFDGRVAVYYKGYYPQRKIDYKINRPTKVKLLTAPLTREPLPLVTHDKNALIGYIMSENKAFYRRTGRPYDEWYVKLFRQWRAGQTKPEVAQ